MGAFEAFTRERLSTILQGGLLPSELCHNALHSRQVARAFAHEKIFLFWQSILVDRQHPGEPGPLGS